MTVDPADRLRGRATHLLDNLDAAAEQAMGPQCRTVSAGVRCVLNLDHAGDCDVRPWTKPGKAQ